MTSTFYFAYGSNLSAARLRGRAPSAVPRGVARAPGYALRLDKRGSDGSAKANIHPALDGVVWGVVYALDPEDWPRLDACERHYARVEIDVWRSGEEAVRVHTYRSDHLTRDVVAFAWYKQLLLDGAREHGLPPEWYAVLEALPAR